GAADLRRAMRVAADRARNAALFRERLSAAVVGHEGLARVEDLDAVEAPPHPLQRAGLEVIQAIAAEGVRHRSDATLLVDARDGVLRREITRDRLLEEEADDLAVAARHLLAHDHAQL